MSISVRIFEFRMGIGIEKSDKFRFVVMVSIINRINDKVRLIEYEQYQME